MWNYEDPAADYNYESQIFLQNFSSNSLEASSFTGYQYLVEKIVLANDQQASLNLQDVLKTGPVEAKTAVIDATFPHALSLIRNRFGNFLMQKCLEFGSRDQVRHLANIMIGHIYGLSCDRFGCHVVQKALDVCEDDVKVEIINELFRAIPETITHRFACHVWQRVFETKWTQCGVNYRPRIAHRVEAALRSQWHLVANDENGSLVVQCIFENCTETEKSAIGREVLAHTVDIAKGQWGNWVIQHLLEHGSPADKSHILKIVARNVHAMSVDQFASKVVEKGLKTCPKRDLYEIVDMVISPSRDNGRPSILDMMNNQYANYVVQHILTLSDPHQRDACARLIAPHLPILRGSKYGQRVAAIVEKHMRTSQQRFGTILGSSTNNVGHTVTVSNQSQLSTSSSIGSSYTSAPNNNYLPVSVGPTSLPSRPPRLA
ncbi:armadillo-type protein [Zopfochytrium polystomum]|nr:armadillo-type protein [Zopfochytrium polystomum]